MEGVRSARSEVLSPLLKHCRQVTAVRHCVQWAEELGLGWAAAARSAAKRFSGRERWSARFKDGITLTLNP